MKNILFRAKRIDNNEWVYGDLIHDISEHNTLRICIDREYSTGTTFVANAPRNKRHIHTLIFSDTTKEETVSRFIRKTIDNLNHKSLEMAFDKIKK